jgi:hypothetical protein
MDSRTNLGIASATQDPLETVKTHYLELVKRHQVGVAYRLLQCVHPNISPALRLCVEQDLAAGGSETESEGGDAIAAFYTHKQAIESVQFEQLGVLLGSIA